VRESKSLSYVVGEGFRVRAFQTVSAVRVD
jgi:hypothetical protein